MSTVNQDQLLVSNMARKLSKILRLIEEVNAEAHLLDTTIMPHSQFQCTDGNGHDSSEGVYNFKMDLAEFAVRRGITSCEHLDSEIEEYNNNYRTEPAYESEFTNVDVNDLCFF